MHFLLALLVAMLSAVHPLLQPSIDLHSNSLRHHLLLNFPIPHWQRRPLRLFGPAGIFLHLIGTELILLILVPDPEIRKLGRLLLKDGQLFRRIVANKPNLPPSVHYIF